MFKAKKMRKVYTVTIYYYDRDMTETITTDAAGVNGLLNNECTGYIIEKVIEITKPV